MRKSHNRNNKLHMLFVTAALCTVLTGCDFYSAMESASQKLYEISHAEKESYENTEPDYDAGADGYDNDYDSANLKNESDIYPGKYIGSAGTTDVIAAMEGEQTVQESIGNGFAEEDSNTLTDQNGAGHSKDIKVYDTSGNLVEAERKEKEIEIDSEVPESEIWVSQDELNSIAKEVENCYAYSQIDDTQKKVYCEIYSILKNMREKVFVSTKDTSVIGHVFDCIIVDHPEIFYVKGYSLGKYIRKDKIEKISVSGTYTMSYDEMLRKKELVDRYVTGVIEKAPYGDDYEKIKFVYEYVVDNTEYDKDVPDNQNILSVIEYGRTVCAGYAKITQLLLNRMGIFCTQVNGKACGRTELFMDDSANAELESHVWNIVRSNGHYYIVDTTWGDVNYRGFDEAGVQIATQIGINYEYLMATDSDIRRTHRPSPVVNMPVCNSFIDNYYVRENCYFTMVDTEQLFEVFNNAYNQGKSTANLKMEDSGVYDEMMMHLIGNQRIFDYISGDSVKYVELPERNLIIITL